jgi:glyoxylase-like metal-dependent hydrolase (beta-lactamase superfamily II)
MQLEDHLGDILRKGRLHSSVTTTAAAAAAGLSIDELASLEDTGICLRSLDFPAFAPLLGLNPDKLAAIARGWLPHPVDLSSWRELRVVVTPGAGMTVNAFLVWDEVTREAALFDTGFDEAPVVKLIGENGLDLRHIFITHGHPDHVAALPALRQRFPKIRIRCGSRSAPVEQRNKPNECIALGSLRITHRETPGHADDAVTYIVGNWPDDAPHVAIVGDALFAGSMGRALQHPTLARDLIRDRILALPAETLLCPGHGPLTTVAEEKKHNPFF